MSRWVHFSIYDSAISFPFFPRSLRFTLGQVIHPTESLRGELIWRDVTLTLLREERMLILDTYQWY
jgi:hypothetical protein